MLRNWPPDLSFTFLLSFLIKAFGSTLPETPYKTFKLNIYIHDSNTNQTRGPFSVESKSNLSYLSTARLLPVYNASQQNEPQFLAIIWYNTGESPITIDMCALGGPSQFWSELKLPPNILMSERLDPSCRTREDSRRLVVAGVVSSLFGLAMAAFGFVWRRRKQRSKNNKADQILAAVAPNQEQELVKRSRDPQAPIRDDNKHQS